MAAGPIITYRANIAHVAPNDLVGANLRMALVSSAYTPDASNTGHTAWASVSANEIAGGTGYTTGGYGLTGVVTAVTNGFKVSSGNPTWTAAGTIAAWRYAVLYWLGTIDGVVNPVIGYCLGDSTPADVPATTVGNTLTINCPAGGWYDTTEA